MTDVFERQPFLNRIDPDLVRQRKQLVDAIGPGGLPAVQPVERRRQVYRDMARSADTRKPGFERVHRTDFTIPTEAGGLRIRCYRRNGLRGPVPALLLLHGGGMMFGSIETSDTTAAALANDVDCVVASVDYRLAPEHPYPAAVDDGYSSLRWLIESAVVLDVDPERVGVYGISAGGGLAALLCIRCRDLSGPKPRYQMLIAPMLDDRPESWASMSALRLGIWDAAANADAWAAWLGAEAAIGSPHPPAGAVPSRTKSLRGLPPTYIEVGDLDLFRDQDIHYASRLATDHVSVELHVYPGAYHSFEELAPGSKLAAAARRNQRDALRRGLSINNGEN